MAGRLTHLPVEIAVDEDPRLRLTHEPVEIAIVQDPALRFTHNAVEVAFSEATKIRLSHLPVEIAFFDNTFDPGGEGLAQVAQIALEAAYQGPSVVTIVQAPVETIYQSDTGARITIVQAALEVLRTMHCLVVEPPEPPIPSCPPVDLTGTAAGGCATAGDFTNTEVAGGCAPAPLV